MKAAKKTTVRVEMTDQETQKIVKQNFSNVRSGQPESAMIALAEVVQDLAKEKADIQGTYEVVEYQILKDMTN